MRCARHSAAVAEREAEVFGDLVVQTTAVIATCELSQPAKTLDLFQRVGDVTDRDADRLAGAGSAS